MMCSSQIYKHIKLGDPRLLTLSAMDQPSSAGDEAI